MSVTASLSYSPNREALVIPILNEVHEQLFEHVIRSALGQQSKERWEEVRAAHLLTNIAFIYRTPLRAIPLGVKSLLF